MSALTEAVSRYGAVAAGIVLRTAAKNGLALNQGKPVTWRSLLSDILLLGLLGLLAVSVSDYFNLTGNAKVLAGAMVAVSSDRLVRAVQRKFEERLKAELDQIPVTRHARLIGGEPKPTDQEFRELLKRVDDADDNRR